MTLEAYRQDLQKRKRRAITEAAKVIFATDGYTHTAMAEIARVADVSTATLYKHFESKENLFTQVVKNIDETGEEGAVLEFVSEAVLNSISELEDLSEVTYNAIETMRNLCQIRAVKAAE